jgi:hypothetical protein
MKHWCINKYRCVRKGRDNLLFIEDGYSYKNFWHVVRSCKYNKLPTYMVNLLQRFLFCLSRELKLRKSSEKSSKFYGRQF